MSVTHSRTSSGGEDNVEPVQRTMLPGEHFFEYMHMPNRFDFVGDWVVTLHEYPYKWGFKSAHWHGTAMPTHIDVTYTFEKIDDNTTRWSRHRINTSDLGKNDLEEEYQEITKQYLEKGIPRQPRIIRSPFTSQAGSPLFQ
ncbi:hypothetical protein N7470_002174 [Penicillium chermesinum]|nr:hypothetical protein N7470_002174 [Penicillium chermesinum]